MKLFSAIALAAISLAATPVAAQAHSAHESKDEGV